MAQTKQDKIEARKKNMNTICIQGDIYGPMDTSSSTSTPKKHAQIGKKAAIKTNITEVSTERVGWKPRE